MPDSAARHVPPAEKLARLHVGLRDERRHQHAELRKGRRTAAVAQKRRRTTAGGADADLEPLPHVEDIEARVTELAAELVRFKGGRIDALAEVGSLLATGEAAVEVFLSNRRALPALLRALHEPPTQLPACLVVVNIAGSSSTHARAVADAAPFLVLLLETESPPVIDLCGNALGNLAADGLEAAATVRANGAVVPLVRLLSHVAPHVVRSAAFALSHVLRGATLEEMESSVHEIVLGAVSAFASHGQRRDVAAEIMWMVAYVGVDNPVVAEGVRSLGFARVVMDGIVAEVSNRLPEEHDPTLLCPALRVVGNTLALGPTDTADIITTHPDGLATLIRLVRSPVPSVRAESVWVVATLANSDDGAHAVAVADAGVLPHIVALLSAASTVASEAVSALLGIAHRSHSLAARVVAANSVPSAVALLRAPDVGLQMAVLQLLEVVSSPG